MTAVYCFSGTGHSFAVARYCADALNAPLFRLSEDPSGKAVKKTRMPVTRKEGDSREATQNTGDRTFVIFPVYCQAIPRPVKDFLKELDAEKVILIATYGRISHGNVLRNAQKITPACVCAAAYLPTGHTYLPGISRKSENLPDPEACTQNGTGGRAFAPPPRDIAFDTAAIDRLLAADRKDEVRIPFFARHLLAGFLPGVRSRIAVKLRKNAHCTGCGKCAAACPFGEMQNGTPGKNCRRCLACVYACPRHALSFTLTRVLRRYLFRHTQQTASAEVFL